MTTSSLNILLVEDDAPLLDLAAHSLRSAGHDVVAVTSAEEARSILGAGTSVDCLVTDVALPGASGLELVSAVTGERPDLLVVFATGQGDPRIHAEIRATGHPLLLKPYLPASLCAAVSELQAGHGGVGGGRS